MVSQKDIRDLDFETIEQYFDYIVNSKTNGNFSQVENLIQNLSKQQKKDFIAHIMYNYLSDQDAAYCKNLTLKSL